MSYTYRHLPHWVPEHAPVFVTWRLANSLPLLPDSHWNNSSSFVASLSSHDDPLDQPRTGPLWLQDPCIAAIVANALIHAESARRLYTLHAWVVMPNHVHAIFTPLTQLSTIMQYLKSRTARAANRLLHRTGQPFWQDESFDHWIRNTDELHALIAYVESNPVKAHLAPSITQYPFSSASSSGTGHRLPWPVAPR